MAGNVLEVEKIGEALNGGARIPLPPPPPLRFDELEVPPNGIDGILANNINDIESFSIIPYLDKHPEVMQQKDSKDARAITDMFSLMDIHIERNLEHPGITADKCWSNLWNTLEGKIAIISSPGPSLRFQLEKIKELKNEDDIVVFGINRILRGLLPHYYLVVERRGLPEWWKGIPSGKLKDVTLLATPQTDHRLVEQFEKVYWGFTNLGGFGKDKRINWLQLMDGQASGTIATLLWTMHKFKPKAVILTGCDFAIDMSVTDEGRIKMENMYFDQDFKSSNYCLRSAYDPSRGRIYISPDKWNRKHVAISKQLMTYRDLFEVMCYMVDVRCGIPVINATEHGMLNWRNMKLDDAIQVARDL